ncbi:MAG: hypothetical protein KAJ09_14425, partial [Deltaproteobacteria bacterium]|nr:hypothetical protein [Deltaproteobacteria bacterium]
MLEEDEDGKKEEILFLGLERCGPLFFFSNNNSLKAPISSMLEMANSWTVRIPFGSTGYAITFSTSL